MVDALGTRQSDHRRHTRLCQAMQVFMVLDYLPSVYEIMLSSLLHMSDGCVVTIVEMKLLSVETCPSELMDLLGLPGSNLQVGMASLQFSVSQVHAMGGTGTEKLDP